MKSLEMLSTYFQGEKSEALVFILPIGLLSLVFGGWLLAEGEAGFTRGVAIPFLLMGLVMAVVGGVVGFRTPSQVKTLETAISQNAPVAVKEELSRMERVNKAWPRYLVIWALFGISGLALRFLTKSDFAQGIGIALVFFSGVCLLIDGFAERRSRPYTQSLEADVQEMKLK